MGRKDSRQGTEMLPEYDSRGGERGRYARRYAEGDNVAVLSPDVSRAFPEPVEEALRGLKNSGDRGSAR